LNLQKIRNFTPKTKIDIVLTARKTTTHTYEGSRLLGVHIGVYQPCPDLKRTLVAMSERTGMSVSQVTDEVLYKGLIGMQEMDELE